MIVTMQDYTITDRAPVLIGYEGENLSRNFTVETADDLSGIASIELLIGDVNCGAMTVNTDDTEITISLDAFMIGRAGYKKAQLIMLDDTGAVVMKSNQFDVLVGASNNPRYYAAGEKVKTLTVSIDGRTRQIILPAGFAVSVNGDVAVDHIAFKAPASYGDFDFGAAACRVDWTGVDGTSHTNICVEKDADGNWIWALPTALTRGGEGEISFSVSYIVTDATTGAVTADWNTGLVKFYHLESAKSDDAEEDVEEETTYDRLASAIAAVRAAQASVDDVNAIIAGITSATPTVVETVADLNGLDTSKVKLAIVAADGYLYYYNGTAWVSGFAYGGLQEVIAARTDSDGVTHADLKTRLNTAEAQIKEDLSDLNSTLVASLSTANKSGGGVDFTYVPADGSFNVTTETVVTNKNQAWKNLIVGASDLFGMVPGEKYYCEIVKSGEGAETVNVWWKFYRDGTQSGNSHALYNSGFITIDDWASGIVMRIAASTDGVALNCNIKIRLEHVMSNRALQESVSSMTDKLAGIQPGLKILTLGDSIALGTRNGNKGFVGDLGMPYVNIAVSGASISTVRTQYTNVFTQLINYRSANPTYMPDCIVANGGINDYISGAQMGAIPTVPAMSDTEAEALDKATLMGATGYLFYQMVKLYPRAQRFFVIIHKIKRGENDIYYPTHVRPGIDYTQEDMHDALVKICSVYGVKVIDVYKDSMLNTAFSQYVSPTAYSTDPTVTDLYFTDTDGLHPLALGYKEAYVPLVKLALMGATKKVR